eukprot:PRCOL_00003276-RA
MPEGVQLRDAHNVTNAGLKPHQGQLTDLGVEQLNARGVRLRALLVDAHGLLPATLDARGAAARRLRVRSTPMRRTVQSAQALLLGLYPLGEAEARAAAAAPADELGWEADACVAAANRPELHVDEHIDAFVSPDRPAALDAALAAAKERAEAATPAREALRSLFEGRPGLAAAGAVPHSDADRRAASGAPVGEANASTHKLLSPTALWDSLSRRRDHGVPLPRGVSDACVDAAGQHVEAKLRAQYGGAEGEAMAAITVGRLVLTLVDELARAAAGEDGGHRVSVWAAHDTTLIPLLVLLGAYDFVWPPIASEVRVELWETGAERGSGAGAEGAAGADGAAAGETTHRVRVVYNDEVLRLPYGADGDASAADWGCCVHALCEGLRAKLPAEEPARFDAPEAALSRGRL